jgi:hypothetical protein
MLGEAERSPLTLSLPGRRLLERLLADPGEPARCWPTALIGRRLRQGPPSLERLVAQLRQAGWYAGASGVMTLLDKGPFPTAPRASMASEIFGTAALFWVLIPVGLAGGALLLKLLKD